MRADFSTLDVFMSGRRIANTNFDSLFADEWRTGLAIVPTARSIKTSLQAQFDTHCKEVHPKT